MHTSIPRLKTCAAWSSGTILAGFPAMQVTFHSDLHYRQEPKQVTACLGQGKQSLRGKLEFKMFLSPDYHFN